MNDVIDAIDTRIKSPYFGYAILAFFALNWRGIFLLIATEAEPSVRLEAFDSETSYVTLVVLPLIVGAVVAISSHWLRFIFLLAAEKPLELIENSNLEAEHKRSIRHAELERSRAELAATQERELIERAERDEQIAEIKDESKKQELLEGINKLRKEKDSGISLAANELLFAAAKDESGTIMKLHTLGEQKIQAGSQAFGSESKREYKKYEAVLDELIATGYIEPIGHEGKIFELTNKGWGVVDAS